MKQFTQLVQDFWRAVVAIFDAWVAIWYPPRDVAPFIAKSDCVETVGYVYLCLEADLQFPKGWDRSPVDRLRTDLGSGEHLYYSHWAADGSQVFQQRLSVLQLVVLPPGLIIPDQFEARCAVALAASTRSAVRL